MKKLSKNIEKLNTVIALSCLFFTSALLNMYGHQEETVPQKNNTFFEYMVGNEQKGWIGYIQGEVLVRFTEGVEPKYFLKEIGLDAQNVERLHSTRNLVNAFKNESTLKRDENGYYCLAEKTYKNYDDIPDAELFKEAYKTLSPEEKDLYRIYRIYLPEGTDVRDVVDALNASADIEHAEPHYVIQHAQ